jgi:hypothetical protein
MGKQLLCLKPQIFDLAIAALAVKFGRKPFVIGPDSTASPRFETEQEAALSAGQTEVE